MAPHSHGQTVVAVYDKALDAIAGGSEMSSLSSPRFRTGSTTIIRRDDNLVGPDLP